MLTSTMNVTGVTLEQQLTENSMNYIIMLLDNWEGPAESSDRAAHGFWAETELADPNPKCDELLISDEGADAVKPYPASS